MPNQVKHGEDSKNADGFRYGITIYILASFYANIDRSPSDISSPQPQLLPPWPDHPYCKTEKFLHDTRGIAHDPAARKVFDPRLDHHLKVFDQLEKAFAEDNSTRAQLHGSSHASSTTNRDLNSSGVETSAVEWRNVEEMTHHHQVQSPGRGNGRSLSTHGRAITQVARITQNDWILQMFRPLQGEVLQTTQMILPPQYAAVEQGSAQDEVSV